jgi:hypothetical protein
MRAVLNGAQPETADGTHNATSTIAGTDIADLTTAESMFVAFPEELQAAIVKKKVRTDVVAEDAVGNNVTSYDRLWLFSATELWNCTNGFADTGFALNSSRYFLETIRQHDGLQDGKEYATYSRQRKLEIYDTIAESYAKMKVYDERGELLNYWMRSLTCFPDTPTTCDTTGSPYDEGYAKTHYIGISPGFCIGEIE